MSGKSNSNSSTNVGVPVKLLIEAEGMKITVEMKSGEIYRGLLISAEGETMNVSLSDVLKTLANGQVRKFPASSLIYLKGTAIRFIALPELLKNSPLFTKVATQKRKLEKVAAEKMGESSRSKKRKTMDH